MGQVRALGSGIDQKGGSSMKAILTWHSVDDSGSVSSITTGQLERQLDWLASGRVRVVPFKSILSDRGDGDTIALTFDDGFLNFASAAAPLLRARGLPATVFVIPSRVGTTNTWNATPGVGAIPSLDLMSWDDIRSMEREGFEIGSHGLTHAPLAPLSAAELATEVGECASIIEAAIGRRPSSFAYPYGIYDAATIGAVSKSFSIACTTRFDFVNDLDSPFELPRLDTYYFRDNRILEEWGTARFKAYIRLRKAARTLKSAVGFAIGRSR
jgi:peptidoglycan/xylan/chitin deacetylase (PgdA/CDA1 family)